MDQEEEDLVEMYSAGFQDAVEACVEYLEQLAYKETYYDFANIYIRIAKELREKIKSE
jgi:alkyl sulfatase BDS1-like metallo-beta-lactamase superfamily hydrolase